MAGLILSAMSCSGRAHMATLIRAFAHGGRGAQTNSTSGAERALHWFPSFLGKSLGRRHRFNHRNAFLFGIPNNRASRSKGLAAGLRVIHPYREAVATPVMAERPLRQRLGTLSQHSKKRGPHLARTPKDQLP